MIDREQIYKWWNIFQKDGDELCEIRCMDASGKTYSGYYRDVERLIADVEPLSNRDNLQIYFVLNSINKDCYDRPQRERIIEKPKNTTSDNDIIGRTKILLDFDPVRPAGIGSTKEQLEDAHKVARAIYLTKGSTSRLCVVRGTGGMSSLAWLLQTHQRTQN